MNKTVAALVLMLLLSSCSGWVIQPLPYNPPTPFLPPTNTPSFFTATPVVLGAASPSPQFATSTPIPFITATTAPTVIASVLPSETTVSLPSSTSLPGPPAVSVEILGCNTSIDISHGMGEVTNAFVVVKNTGGVELTNIRVTLNARDEGRPHPDKTVGVTSLAVGYQVSLKLTVDSTYKAETPIQVEVTGDAGLFQRVGAESCRDIGVLVPNPDTLNTPAPINP
jgi:hypothetical protein